MSIVLNGSRIAGCCLTVGRAHVFAIPFARACKVSLVRVGQLKRLFVHWEFKMIVCDLWKRQFSPIAFHWICEPKRSSFPNQVQLLLRQSLANFSRLFAGNSAKY